MSFFNENFVNEIENRILNDFESILDNKQLNQQEILKLLTKLVFCITKVISQIPSIFNVFQQQINNYNQKFTRIDSDINLLIEKEKEEENKEDIFEACEKGKLASVQWLIEKQNVDKDIKDREEKTPLHYACLEGHLPIVEYLISKGANIEAEDKNEKTPLHFASYYGKTDVVEYLVSKGADKNAKTKDGETPYDLACQYYFADKSQKNQIENTLR